MCTWAHVRKVMIRRFYEMKIVRPSLPSGINLCIDKRVVSGRTLSRTRAVWLKRTHGGTVLSSSPWIVKTSVIEGKLRQTRDESNDANASISEG